MQFRFFFELPGDKYPILLLLEFQYDKEIDWYEVKVFRGEEVIAYLNGYANQGWAPQVNNLWVAEAFRRKGIASQMMTKVEEYFGQVPLPATPVADNEAARSFWDNYAAGRSIKGWKDQE